MIISIILVLLIIAGAVIHEKFINYDFAGFALSWISFIALLMNLIFWWIYFAESKTLVHQRDAYVYSLVEARCPDHPYEMATITRDIAQWNSNLKKSQYWNSTILFDSYFSDDIENLQMIK